MYILGNLRTARALPSAGRDHVQESEIRALILPHFAEARTFAYTRVREKEGDTAGRLIRSHIAGDWWIHFGDDPTRRQAHGENTRAMHEPAASVEHEHFRPAAPGPPLKTPRALPQRAMPSTGAEDHVAA